MLEPCQLSPPICVFVEGNIGAFDNSLRKSVTGDAWFTGWQKNPLLGSRQIQCEAHGFVSLWLFMRQSLIWHNHHLGRHALKEAHAHTGTHKHTFHIITCITKEQSANTVH